MGDTDKAIGEWTEENYDPEEQDPEDFADEHFSDEEGDPQPGRYQVALETARDIMERGLPEEKVMKELVKAAAEAEETGEEVVVAKARDVEQPGVFRRLTRLIRRFFGVD